VLDLTVSEALAFFAADAEVCLRLAPLAEVGLDYLRSASPCRRCRAAKPSA
jgi:excinuclease ABC subunit A